MNWRLAQFEGMKAGVKAVVNDYTPTATGIKTAAGGVYGGAKSYVGVRKAAKEVASQTLSRTVARKFVEKTAPKAVAKGVLVGSGVGTGVSFLGDAHTYLKAAIPATAKAYERYSSTSSSSSSRSLNRIPSDIRNGQAYVTPD